MSCDNPSYDPKETEKSVNEVVMKKYKWHLSIGLVGVNQEGVVEVPDNATDTEIDEAVKEEVFNYIDWSYWPADRDDED